MHSNQRATLLTRQVQALLVLHLRRQGPSIHLLGHFKQKQLRPALPRMAI